ncbi:MAG TPA: hypothetical protein VMF12_04325 [Xanthobacteraceae bacterium]|nr:hypothetical protein [Xanthobacteraceae bacterium]
MAKAKKPRDGKVQHTWKVTRTNNQSIDVTADGLTVIDGDLVFSTTDVVVRVIAANTYSDVELLGPQAASADASALFQSRTKTRAQ